MNKKLLILTTGGTIDKIYFDDKSDYQIGEPQIGDTLHAMNVAFDYEIVALMRKDSLHIDDDDRQRIRAAVEASNAEFVLITHGTDSMVQTAEILRGIPGRRIVLTGSLIPARFRDSDAVFNIGCALGAVQCVEPGVWIVMNNVEENRFQSRLQSV
jgi:L-asparaginase